jgi:hypothetical protein
MKSRIMNNIMVALIWNSRWKPEVKDTWKRGRTSMRALVDDIIDVEIRQARSKLPLSSIAQSSPSPASSTS